MLFSFLKYLQPTHYFLLKNKKGLSVFPKIKELPSSILSQLEEDEEYKDSLSREYDLSWQAIQKGYIGKATTFNEVEKIPIEDEYLFIRKYYNKVWTSYILVLRILGFKNPFKEIKAWLKSKKAVKSNYLENPIKYTNWVSFNSELIKENNKVTIIIPTLNRYKYLKDVLHDLEKQIYSNFEVIIVDQSEPFNKNFYKEFNLDLKLIHQKEKALWLARNRAIKLSESNFILLFDDDSRVEKDWITNHLKCLDFFKAKISSGVSFSLKGAEIPTNYSFFRISDQIDTGNVLIKKEVFKELGLFDRQFEKQRMGDGEFGLRSHLHGFLNVSNPYAKRLHLKVGTGGLRQMGSWDGFRPKKWFDPRPVPSVVYFFRKYFGNYKTKLLLLKAVPPSVIPYQYKKNKKMMSLGFLISLLLFPIIITQVIISWRLASKKLNEGEMIEKI